MSNNEMLIQALRIALDAHKDQVDKCGISYILHPLHVMNNVESIEHKIIAILHDTVEDCNWVTIANLRSRQGFSDRIVDAVEALTRRHGEPCYMDYIKRVNKNKDAKTVKLKDLEHNLDTDRLWTLDEKTVERLCKKYTEALIYLREH